MKAAKYWEKVEESDSSGSRVLRIRCAAKVGIAKAQLAEQLRAATGTSGNAEMRAKLLEQQKQFIDGLQGE